MGRRVDLGERWADRSEEGGQIGVRKVGGQG